MSIENATNETAPTFATLGLNPAILKAVEESGYTTPTPIQAQAIPEVLAGHDIMASAQTGTGKTAAFILPALHRIAEPPAVRSKGPRVLVLTPTRELAQQVSDAAAKYGKNMRLKVVSILGGMPYPLQNKLLSNPVDILVATPGRLIDHIERGRIDFSRLEMLVLDEADRMLDMGFIDDVERIAAATPATRQTLLFSATLDGVIGNLANRLLKSPKRITVAAQKARHENIEQRLMYVDDMAHKNRLLDHLLRDTELSQALVFTATKRDADELADGLLAQGHSAAALHGDMSQRERNRTLLNMRRGQVRVLVATDVAARGIDVAGISHVINFDLPKFAEDYVHRIGRTGRAGASGIAVSFASNRDAQHLKKIERYTGHSIAAHTISGLEPRFKPRPQPSGSRGKPGGYGRPNSHHTAPDSRHGRPDSVRREGHSHNRFDGGAPRHGGNSATPGQARRPASSFTLGRGHNSGNR
ncbi:MAG: DEAD/DEAH box helicase domain protein [Gallionellaceae bacterium]|nr:MAG: DEAD/DEAH box helicase domain protein [Gallionellaceae bacterium]